MRHGKKFNHLGRTASHRAALLSNMASSLILHKRIETTVAKAKELRKYVEPLITKSKDDSTNNRRVVFAYLQNKESVKELFGIVSEKVANRPGGYTRIIKLGNRLGDNAEICFIELVDFNETMLAASAEKAGKTRRSRRSGAKKEEGSEAIVAAAPAIEAPSAEVVEDAVVVEEVVAETEVAVDEVAPEEVVAVEAPAAEVVAETEAAVEEVAPEEVVAEEASATEEPTDAPASEEPTEEKGEDA
ncbi:MAG: 50S ribosomal protein L17 [Cytophagia bacterium]|nr:50S ribosomal protein L17 [Cytophagia bacterium]